MSAVSGPSFVSYVNEAERSKERDQKLVEAMSKMYERPEKDLENKLLPGEIAIGLAKKVIRYNVHDDPTRGISGTLVCTNFRLIFITAEKATYDLIELRNRLVSDHDILLNNIESIYIEYPNKRKRLVPGSKVKDNIHRLELHCKDFRVAAFNFKLTVGGEEKVVINSILHHAYPATVSLLFAFDYDHGKDIEKECEIPLYRSQAQWEAELLRCSVSKKYWRVTVLNRKLATLPSMGAYFVVPTSIRDNEVLEAADQFMGTRVPSWCWSDSNGCSLVRSSTLRPEIEQQHIEDKFFKAIENADPNKRELKVIDVSKQCPSCLQLQQSFNKLKTICMPATESDFWETDAHWKALLHSTKWLQHIGTTLEVAKTAANELREKEQNVVIQEPNGVDLSSVVISLVQLMLDPTCRTFHGFQALIQREWVVAGHPFLDRLGHLLQPTKRGKQVPQVLTTGENNVSTKLSPVFLLFLDCVYQLMVQFPARFEFSVTFLTVLYDATRTTAFDTFLFNNERQRHRKLLAKDHPSFEIQEVSEPSSWNFLPIWVWNAQFNKTDMTLFNNPLYKMRTMEGYRQYIEESGITNTKTVPSYSQNINGDCPVVSKSRIEMDALHGEEKSPESPTRSGKHKTSKKEKRAEEHRKKIEKDSPFPLNKTRQKTGSLEDNRKIASGEKTEENSNDTGKKVPTSGTISGHYPKVALMPKHRHISTTQTVPDISPERRTLRSKSDSDYGEECSSEEKSPPPSDVTVLKPAEDGSPKLKPKFSFRRRKTKEEGLFESDISPGDVPTYDVLMQNDATRLSYQIEDKGAPHPLYPCTINRRLEFWKQCYLRWIPWSQIYGGGPAATLQQESILYDEIHVLHTKLLSLKRKLQKSDVFHTSGEDDDMYNTSGMFFNHSLENVSVFETSSQKSSSQNDLDFLSSYFPYSPVKGLRRKSVIGTPISNFLQGGSIFNFGRFRVGKHSRSPSNISISHSMSHSIEDLSCATDSNLSSSLSKSVEDLTSDGDLAPTGDSTDDARHRTQSDVPGVRTRLRLLDSKVTKPRKGKSPSPSPTTENITYITSL